MSQWRQSNTAELPRVLDGRNFQLASSRSLSNQRLPKSSRRSLFKENMSPRLKASRRPRNAWTQICNFSLKKIPRTRPIQENVCLQPTENRTNLRNSEAHWQLINRDGIEHEGIETLDENARPALDVQDNVMYQRQFVKTVREISKEVIYIQDNVINRLDLTRPNSQGTCDEGQDNVTFNKSHTNRVENAQRRLCSELDHSGSSLCHEENLITTQQLSGADQNLFKADSSGLTHQQGNEELRHQPWLHYKDQDDGIFKPSLHHQDKSRTVTTPNFEQNQECANPGEGRNWTEAAGTGSDQSSSVEEVGETLLDDDVSMEDQDTLGRTKTPEQWLLEPLQRLVNDITAAQPDCLLLDHPSGTMDISQPGSSMSHNLGQAPSKHPEQCVASVHRVEELIIQSPLPPSGDIYFALPSSQHQSKDYYPVHHSLDQQNSQAPGLQYEGHHRNDIQQDSNFYSAEDNHRLGSSDVSKHQVELQRSETTPRKHPGTTGFVLGGGLDARQVSPSDSPGDQNRRWYAPVSGSWVEAPVPSRRSLYSHLEGPTNHISEVQSSPLSSNHSNGLNYSVMESQWAPESDIRNSCACDWNYSVPITTSAPGSSIVFPLSSNRRFEHLQPNSTSDFSGVPDSTISDLRELDKLDYADLYRLSEADEFVHSKPLEGLYTRSTPLKRDKKSMFRKESNEFDMKMGDGNRLENEKEKEKEGSDEDKDKDACDLRIRESLSKNRNNSNLDADLYQCSSQPRIHQTFESPSKHGWRQLKFKGTPKKPERYSGIGSSKIALNSKLDNHRKITSPVRYRSQSTSPLMLPADQIQRDVSPSRELTDSALLQEIGDRQIQSQVSLSPSPLTGDSAVLQTKLQYSLQSDVRVHVPFLNVTSHERQSLVKGQLPNPIDPTAATKDSPLRYSFLESQGVALTIEDLKLSVSPEYQRSNVGNKVLSTRDHRRQARIKDEEGSTIHEYATTRSLSPARPQRSTAATSHNQGRDYPSRSSNQRQSRTTNVAHQRAKNNNKFAKVPRPVKSEGLPKKSYTAGGPVSKSTLSLSSSSSPRRNFSILWAFKILDILHSAPPETHETLVTKLYWFRRWHGKVRLIKAQREKREENWARAVTHHQLQLLRRCLQAWKREPSYHRRAADQLRQKHLLRKGLHGLHWAVSQSKLEIDGATTRLAEKMVSHHFGIWRDLYQVQTERAQLLEKLATKHYVAKTFQTWKDRYSIVQKEGIARLHYKVGQLSRGFQCWKLFTSQSKVKGYRDEMSRVHHEESTIKKAWFTMRVVYIQTQKAQKHYSQKLLSAVIHTWIRGCQISKAERLHQHSQALELRRCGLLRAHLSQWKEELLVVRGKQKLCAVRMRYVWELWTLRLQRQQLYRQIMESQACKVAKQHTFNRWRQVARRQKESAERAAVILRQTYLQMVFNMWRSYVNRENKLRNTLSTLVSNNNLRAKHQALHTWTSRLRGLQVQQAAQRAWSMKCVWRAVRQWKERVRRGRMEEKLRQFQPVHDAHVKRDALRKWSVELQLALRDHHRALSAQWLLLRNKLLRLLLSWRLLAKETKIIAPLLERRKLKRLASSFDAWRDVLLRRKACEQYQSVQYSHAVAAAFMKWRERAASEKKVRSVKESLLISMLTRTLLAWREAAKRQTGLRAFQKQRQDAMVRKVFGRWQQTSEEISVEREVEQGNRAREVLLRTVCFKVWFENAQQEREATQRLVSKKQERCSSSMIRKAYQRWRRQLLVQNIVRSLQAAREASLLHRVFQAWHVETRSSYEQLTKRFHLVYDVMGMGFSNTNTSPKSAQTLNLSWSPSSSSGGSQGLPTHTSTADSGFSGNGLPPPPPPLGGQSSDLDDHQDDVHLQDDPLLAEEGSSDHTDEHLKLSSIESRHSASHINGSRRHQGFPTAREDRLASSDEDLYPEELPSLSGSPRFTGSQELMKKYKLPPSCLRFDTLPRAHSGPLSPVISKQVSFLRRRASLDQSLLGKPHAGHRFSNHSTAKTSAQTLDGSHRASMDQGLLSSPAVLSHLRNIYRKSQTENSLLSSLEEGQEATTDGLPREGSSLPRHPRQYYSSHPHSPEAHSQRTSTHSISVPTPVTASPALRASVHSLSQSGAHDSLSSPLPSPRPASPRLPSSLNHLSKSLSLQSPRSYTVDTLAERHSPQDAPDTTDSRRSSESDCSSTMLESTHSSSYYMQLVGYGQDLSRSATVSECAPSVFSESMAPATPQIDQRTYLRSIILHWHLWPASAAFNQWLDYTHYRRDLRELAEQADSLFLQIRLSRALSMWRRRCYIERLARHHWELRTKAVHLWIWLHHKRDSQHRTRQKTAAREMARNQCLSQVFHVWKTKHKKHKAVLSIVHNWKGYVKQTEDLEGRTKNLRQQIKKRSLQECFSLWKLCTWQILEVKAHHNRVVTHRCLMAWAVWSKENAERQQKLQSFQTKRLKLLVLHHWRAKLMKLQAAREFHHRAVVVHLKSIITRWRRYVSSRQQREAAATQIVEQRQERSVRWIWMVWKQQTQTSKQMLRVYHTNLAIRYLRGWHHRSVYQHNLSLASTITKTSRDVHLQSHAMQVWRQSLQARQLARHMQASLRERQLRQALREWRSYAQQCRSEKYRRKRLLKWALGRWQSRCIEQQSSRSSILRMVHHWRSQTQRSKDLDQAVITHLAQRDAVRRRQAFDVWKLAWKQQSRAVDHCNTAVLGRCLGTWHIYTAAQRERQATLQLYQENKCKKLVSLAFNRWRRDHLHSLERERQLAEFRQQRAVELLAKVFQSWHHVAMEGVAIQKCNRVMRAKAWQRWRKSFSNNQVATQMAEAKQTETITAAFTAFKDWCQARKSQMLSHHLVRAQHRNHSLQVAFSSWKSEMQKKSKAKAHADRILQAKVLKGWIAVAKRATALRVVAETLQRRCSSLKLESALRVWTCQLHRTLLLKRLLEEALAQRDQAQLRETFTRWRRRTMERRAIRHYEGKLMKVGWSFWRQKLKDRIEERQFEEDMGEVADEHFNRCISKKVIGLWLTEARVSRLQKQHDNRLAKKYAFIWKNGSKMDQMARSLDMYRSVRSTWIIWRRRMIQSLMSKTMQQHSDRQLREQTFKAWRKRALPANNGLRRDAMNRRLNAAFRVWRERMEGRDDRSCCSSLSNQSSSAGYTSSSGASELAGIWINAQQSGAFSQEGGSALH